MTDHPRFEPVRGSSHEAHLDYNGGRLVDAVLGLVDRWLASPRIATRCVLPPSFRRRKIEGAARLAGEVL
jgi:hypothetical protein